MNLKIIIYVIMKSTVQVGRTYYDCGSCEKVQDEKGKGSYTKCYPK